MSRQAGPILVVDLQSPGEPVCVKDTEASIGGVGLGVARQDVIDLLGPPLSKQRSPNLLDLWIEERLIYDGLSVDLFQNTVVGMEATGSRWRTPSGMYLGMAESDLERLFGVPVRPNTEHVGDPFHYIYFCSFDEPVDLGSFFQIAIGEGGTVSRLEIATDTP